jgi:hypothetical protein
MEAIEDAARGVQSLLQLLPRPLAQAPVEEELLLGDAEVDLRRDPRGPVDEPRAEQLAESDRVMVAGHGGDESLVEVDALELHPAA